MGWDVNSSVCSPESILAFFLNVFLYFLLSILVSPATINSIGLSSIKAIVLTICPGLTLWANAASSTDAVDVLCSMISRSGALILRSFFTEFTDIYIFICCIIYIIGTLYISNSFYF